MRNLHSFVALLALICNSLIAAENAESVKVIGNPLKPGIGLTDPHVAIYGNTAYLYATHDFSPGSKKFVTKDWWVWSSTDLLNWKLAGTLNPETTFLRRPSDECWAGFGASKHGNYYWYFSAGPTQVGVVMADSPVGPWRDPLGKPLIPQGLPTTEARDPDILMDDDGQAYLVYGTFKYFIVRLNDDMISLAETPHRVQLDHEFGPYGEGKTDDKPSLHKRNGIYYLSWSSFYAMSTNVYGPYTYQGSVIVKENVAPEFQVDKTVRKYDLWHDRHGNFFTWHNQWYYACNDKSLPGRHSHFRDCCLSYVHYRDNGEMAPIRLDAIGVSQYDAAQSKIEGEDYFDAEKAEIKECPSGGFEVRGLGERSRLVYPNVKNLPKHSTVAFRVASARPSGGTIQIREGSADGKLLGRCLVPKTGGWDKYQIVSCVLNNQAATENLCLIFQGGAGELMRLDWLAFSAE
ncbi:MAG: family 43 glycosylhydrolase [Verrucomicrobiota bacterium]